MASRAIQLQQALKLKDELFDISQRAEHVAPLGSGLDKLVEIQGIVSALSPHALPGDDEQASPDQIRTYILAATVELMEVLQELPWKPWKNYKPVDKKRVVDEFADVLAFLGIILIMLESHGITADMIARGYAKKSVVNINRLTGQETNYDNPNNE